MTHYDRLMRELALLTALEPLLDLTSTDVDPEHASLNAAWLLTRKRAAKAADDYMGSPDG